MFSDNLEDKIAAIMRGNFDTKDAKPKKSKKKDSLGISSPTSEISEKSSIVDGEDSPVPITPATEFTKVSRGSTPRVITTEFSAAPAEETKPIVVPVPVAAPSPRNNATGAIPSTTSLPPIKSSPAASPRVSVPVPAPALSLDAPRHSRSNSNAEPLKDSALDALTPSSDIAALILRLQNSSTDTSRVASPAIEEKPAPSIPVTPVARPAAATVGIAEIPSQVKSDAIPAPVVPAAKSTTVAAPVATPATTAIPVSAGTTPASLNISTTSSQPLEDSTVDDMLFGELSRDDEGADINLMQEDQLPPDFAAMSDISDIASERSVQSIAQSIGNNFFNARQKPLSYQRQQQQYQQDSDHDEKIKGNSFLSDFDKDSRDYSELEEDQGGVLLTDEEGAHQQDEATQRIDQFIAAADEDLSATLSTQISHSRNNLSTVNPGATNAHVTPIKGGGGRIAGAPCGSKVKPAVDVLPVASSAPVRHPSPQPATDVRPVSSSVLPPYYPPAALLASPQVAGKGRIVRPADAPSPRPAAAPEPVSQAANETTPRKSPPPPAVIVIENEGSDIKKRPVLSSGNRVKKPAAAPAPVDPPVSPPRTVPNRSVSPHINKKPAPAPASLDEENLPHYMKSRKPPPQTASLDEVERYESPIHAAQHASASTQREATDKLVMGVSPRPVKEIRSPSPPPPLHTSAVTQIEATEKLTKGSSGRPKTPIKVAPTPSVGMFAAAPLTTSSSARKGRGSNITPRKGGGGGSNGSTSRSTSASRLPRDARADFSYSDLAGAAGELEDGQTQPTTSASSPSRERERVQHPVRVAVRVRPFTPDETAQGAKRCIAKQGGKLIVCNPRAFEAEPDTIASAAITMDNKQWAQIFHFNHFLWSNNPMADDPPVEESEYADQVDLYDAVGGEIVNNVLSGVSASCFAYGHTGTGKTHSLFGNIVRFTGTNGVGSGGSSRAITPSKASVSSGSSGSGHSNIRAINEAINAASVISPRSGLIPRVMNDIVFGVNERDVFGHDTKMFFSFLEIYNDKIRDLLSDAATAATESVHGSNISSGAYHHSVEEQSIELLKVREHPVFGPYVENLKKVEVTSPEEVLKLIARGQSNRSTTSTAFNSTSSRSHAVVTLELTPSNYNASLRFISNSQKNNETFRRTLAEEMAVVSGSGAEGDPHQHLFVRVQMVDLAGSEKDSMNLHGSSSGSTRDERGVWNGSRYNDTTPNKHAEAIADKEKNELKIIRRSLSTLGHIIKELAKGAAFRSLPYRDSVLTFLLRDALNGYNHTTMLATISPSGFCYEETLSTLRYAENLCALRNVTFQGEHHSMNSLVSIEKDMGLSRQALLEEFARIHSALGQNKPGSRSASRQLLQQTLADPQQRIAKLTRALEEEAEEQQQLEEQEEGEGEGEFSDPQHHHQHQQQHHDEAHSGAVVTHSKPSPPKRSGGGGSGSTSPFDRHNITNSDLETLKSSYRTLQGHFMELQIDLKDVKADRDALSLDLRVAKEQISQTELVKQDTRSSVAAITKSFKTAEKEIFEYKALIKRKDETIERLSCELTAEKQGRLDAEAAYHSRTKDFLARFEQMKKENKTLSANLDTLLAKQKSQVDDKKDTVTQVDKLKAHVRLLTTARDSLSACVDTLTNDNSTLRLRLQQLTGSSSVTDYQKESADLTLLVGRLQSDLQAMTQERDSLGLLLQQKDSLLKIQQSQADMSIKMLQKRQAQLENGEPSDEYSRLLESLRELFTSEGEVMLSELMDTERLTGLIRDVRDKMLQYDGLLSMYEEEQRSGARQKVDFDLRLGESRRELDTAYARIVQLEKQLQQAAQQQQFSFSTYTTPAPAPSLSPPKQPLHQQQQQHQTPPVNAALQNQLEVQLRTENNLLREQLVIAQSEVNKAAADVRSLKDAHRAELSKVWNSLQELQSVDLAKDKSLQALISDRDRAIAEKDQMEEQLKRVSVRCSELVKEMEEIDSDLIAAVELAAQTQNQTGGPLALHRVPDRLLHGIARRRGGGGSKQTTSTSNGALSNSSSSSSRGYPADLGSGGNQSYGGPQSFVSIAQLIPSVIPSFVSANPAAAAPAPTAAASSYGANGAPFFSESRLAGGAAAAPVQPSQNGYYAAAPPQSSAVPPNGFSHSTPVRQAPAAPVIQQQPQQAPQFQFPSQYQQQQQANPNHLYQQQKQQQEQFHPQSGFASGPSGSFYPGHSSHAPPSAQRPPQQQTQQQYQQHQQQQQPQVQYFQSQPHYSHPAAATSAAPPSYHLHQQQPQHHSHGQPAGTQQIRRPPPPPPADEDKQYELSEKILQRQIEELSEFLDDEAKLKRSRVQARGSSGSLNSLASSGSGQPQQQRLKTYYS